MVDTELRVAKIAAKAQTDAARIEAATQEAVSKASIEAAKLQQKATARLTIATALIAFLTGLAAPLITIWASAPDEAKVDCTEVLTRALDIHSKLPQVIQVVPPDSIEQKTCDVNGKMAQVLASTATPTT